MPVINWRRILDDAGIEYVERGANVKRGELNIGCPFCGSADPSYHMGLNQITGWWACWRNVEHRGKSPVRLLVKLLRIPYKRALELAGLDDSYVDPDGFDGILDRLKSPAKKEEEDSRVLNLPEEFVRIDRRARCRGAVSYLVDGRGFLEEDLDELVELYSLFTAFRGEQSGRVIFPYFERGSLVTWTGRAIGSSRIRYKDLSPEIAITPNKKTLYNFDSLLVGAEILLVVEGPMDALKLDFYGRDWGVRAVGLSTNSVQQEQIYRLEEHQNRFRRILVMMDSADSMGIVDSMKLGGRLGQIHNLGFIEVPFAKKDGAALSPKQIIQFSRSITNGIRNFRVQSNASQPFQGTHSSRGDGGQ